MNIPIKFGSRGRRGRDRMVVGFTTTYAEDPEKITDLLQVTDNFMT
jgi:hypothetical protein